MPEQPIYSVPVKATLSQKQYHEMYTQSLQNPQQFWGEQAEHYISWFKRWDEVQTGTFEELNSQWFVGGKLNACYNAIDRHLEKRAQQIALIVEGDEPGCMQKITYAALHTDVCRLANVLKKQHIQKGDRVCIYMPMIAEAVVAMLACARIGAVHSVVFGGFSAEALKTRILNADCRLVITANEGVRGGKIIPLKKNVDEALRDCPLVQSVIVIKRTDGTVSWLNPRDQWYHEGLASASSECSCEEMDSADPLFILYTSGSTGKPKGIVHTHGGYLVYAAMTHKIIFDYQEGDIHWCTADVGWITGHSYAVYGPLCNAATTVIFEGIPTYPTPARCWEIIDQHQVTIFYTAPTAIRALRREGDHWVNASNRQSLKLLGSVGEPINPDVWEWYFNVVGNARCPIVDTWWQTETGGIMISALPGATPLKAGSASWPFFGVVPEVVDDQGKKITNQQMGKLIISKPWPGMMQTIYGDASAMQRIYFNDFPHAYLTGDNAVCDVDNYFWIAGRCDDVIKVSGHRIGTEEVESALLTNSAVSEAAVVGIAHAIKGESIYAFVTLKANVEPSEALKQQLIQQVRQVIGPIATPDTIQWAAALPKTRSGKIMRRLLRKIANRECDNLGDISTLADPSVVEALIKENR